MYYIGIDGGGTKTSAVIGTDEGHIIAFQTIGATNPNRVGLDICISRLTHLLNQLKQQHKTAYELVHSIYCGISGASQSVYQNAIKQALIPLLPNDSQIVVTHDAIAALYSGTLGEQGMIQISGTGSVSYAVDDQAIEHRVGGWGYLLGDEGSGFSIGREALRATLDESSPQTILTQLITEHYRVHSIEEVIPYLYAKNGQQTIAQLSPLVFQAYKQKDSVATKIIASEAAAIATNVLALTKKASFQDTIPLVLTGGILEQDSVLIPLVQSALSKQKDHYAVITPSVAPVIGALIAAIKPFSQIDRSFEINAIQTLTFMKKQPDLVFHSAECYRTLAKLLANLNQRPEAHIGYCGTDAAEIESTLVEENILLKDCLVATKNDQFVGVLCFDFDEEDAEVWGPFLHKDYDESLANQLWHGHPQKKQARTYHFFINDKNKSVQTFLNNLQAKKEGTYYAMSLPRQNHSATGTSQIHPYQEADRETFASIHEYAFPETYFDSQTILERLNDKRRLLIYKKHQNVCGYTYIEANPEHDEGSIEYLAVKKSERGQGIGKEILQHGVTVLFNDYNLSTLDLTVSATDRSTVRLYKSVGFLTKYVLQSYSFLT